MKVQVEFQEPDRKKRIKRIIAREGLIILGLQALFFIIALGSWLKYGFTYQFVNCALIGVVVYLAILFVRFILWAIKVLKGENR